MVKLWSLETNHCLIGATGLEVLVLSPRNPEDNFLVLLSNVLQRHPEQADLSLLMEYALQETDEQVGIIARFADCLEARCFAVSVVHQLRDSTDQQNKCSSSVMNFSPHHTRPHLRMNTCMLSFWCNLGLHHPSFPQCCNEFMWSHISFTFCNSYGHGWFHSSRHACYYNLTMD